MVNDTPHFGFRLYSVPRRFDLATMMAVTLAYALLFGALRLMRIQPIDIAKVAGLFTCIAIGQAVLYRGKRPRLASVLIGIVYLVGIYLVHAATREAEMLQIQFFVLLIWLAIAMAGAICGYFSGIAVAAVFLVSDMLRKSIQWCRRR